MAFKDQAKEERKRLYFDLICGIISSILAITGIIFFAIMYGITDYAGFITGLIFWIFYLCLSIFMIIIGLYTGYIEKKYGLYIRKRKKKKKKKIEPPIR